MELFVTLFHYQKKSLPVEERIILLAVTFPLAVYLSENIFMQRDVL